MGSDEDTAPEGAAEREEGDEVAEGMGMGWLGTVLIDSEKEEAVEVDDAIAEGSGEAGTAGRAATGVLATTGAESEADGGGRTEMDGLADDDSDDWASAAVSALVD